MNFTILFYPHENTRINKMTYLLKHLGIEATNNPDDNYNLAFWWDYIPKKGKEYQKHIKCDTIINRNCLQEDKKYIDKIFTQIFGYSSFVDPKFHNGWCIIKDNRYNGAHDGRFIKCPILSKINPNLVYQKIIDTRYDPLYVRDLRVCINKKEMLCVFVKSRPVSDMFEKQYKDNPVMAMGEDVFTGNEYRLIIKFAQAMGLDFGELDILRSNYDGKIYIIDMNPIPGDGVFHTMPKPEALKAIKYMAEQFKKTWIDGIK